MGHITLPKSEWQELPETIYIRSCSKCGKLIPQERLQTLPDTETCVLCSQVKPLTENQLDLDGADSHDLFKAVTQGRTER